jgi:hypothetical protein
MRRSQPGAAPLFFHSTSEFARSSGQTVALIGLHESASTSVVAASSEGVSRTDGQR